MTGFGIGGAFVHEPSHHDFALLEDAAALAAEHEVRSTTLLRRGDTVAELVACAEDRNVDLIVLGCRGRGSLASTLLGSVSRGVLREARRPVLIAPPRTRSSDIMQPIGGVGLGL